MPPEQVRSAWGSKLVLLTLWGVAGIAMQGESDWICRRAKLADLYSDRVVIRVY